MIIKKVNINQYGQMISRVFGDEIRPNFIIQENDF